MLWLFDKGRDDGMCQKSTESRRAAGVCGLFGAIITEELEAGQL